MHAANAFIEGVPKGDMVSPQIQEIYMLVEYLSENVDKLKEQMEAFDFYEQLHKDGGVYTVQVKCGTKNDEVIAELTNSDCLWKIQRKLHLISF